MTALKNEYFKQIIALYTYKYAALIFEKKNVTKMSVWHSYIYDHNPGYKKLSTGLNTLWIHNK